MSEEPTDVMIAAYLTTGPAKLDYEAVLHSHARLEGAILVSRDHAGELHVEESDHLARRGAELLGGAGIVVGLFAPPNGIVSNACCSIFSFTSWSAGRSAPSPTTR